MTQLDANKDGKLDEKELEQSTALRNSLGDLDKDGDKAISREELEARLTEMLASKVGIQAISCRVMRGGQPVPNVEVKFVPEKFHGTSLAEASGKSDAEGYVSLLSTGQTFPGIAPGFYRVEASLKDASGNESLPAAVNTRTKLGYQISSRLRGGIEISIP